VSVLAWASTARTWSTEAEVWELTPDEASPEAVAALADGLILNMGDDEVEPHTIAEAAVFALGPKLIHHGDPAIAMGVVRPQNDSERPRAAASANERRP
jgi:hypothetical protein